MTNLDIFGLIGRAEIGRPHAQDQDKLLKLRDHIVEMMEKAGLPDLAPACRDAFDVLARGDVRVEEWTFTERELIRHLKKTIMRSMMNPNFSFNDEANKILNPRQLPKLVEMID